MISLTKNRGIGSIARVALLVSLFLFGCETGERGDLQGEPVPDDQVAEKLAEFDVNAQVEFGPDGSVAAIITSSAPFVGPIAIESGDYEYVVIQDDEIVAVKKWSGKAGDCHLHFSETSSERRYRCVGSCKSGSCVLGGESIEDVGYKVFCHCK
ncbi:MAG: hypothetical protein O7D91_17840 [Planctomycetota bacterium]|nr:hypothetical protein [Planctomycetota bacterium]